MSRIFVDPSEIFDIMKPSMLRSDHPAVMDGVKNMLNYKISHNIKYEDIPSTYKKNFLRSFMLIKQKFFP